MKNRLSVKSFTNLFASRKIRLLTFAFSFFFFALFIELTWELWEQDHKLFLIDQSIIGFVANHRI
ncbi:MAG: hypothetical protein COW00_00180 [Bdellovibrio sp. CG12_big_fil_rev_8_21_14_0_65_39_13]|nr:MAG: hypothetical protein COW78_19915 [Bdellovibrio sp. CG22_combo_CG10-13_8_21_14_all_39_27]PIQ62900.1 MAG: hypothetical protein COW00_00180 [Bdellovibrio sp. CG12_big_fil_rev_8_21_14_0_65_39_13]PIR33255.1 MAG: hypothetical protein COV37_16915 [Bdellovibrio sp. CG11_big_fil_rev_8_21_14_0_20_39_38]PJB52603.1 MAG: hypothetical protein CO099_11750 [Bdellovibrio sp. CG_4_9_14_3_um_filter_39_7]